MHDIELKPPCQTGMAFFSDVNVPWKIISATRRHRPDRKYANRLLENVVLTTRGRRELKRSKMRITSKMTTNMGNTRQLSFIQSAKYIEYALRSSAPTAWRKTSPAKV
ncbi:hypothetical protein AU467_26745 [Mesorhizobium loti]|uniref:Transposase n=1 Tax=Rhizobium loti TaxID=381 RepID=A0A117N2X8_RHILI|nr:hypothetical protein AU467_26745 [Mesorhizobium loti]